MVAHSKMELYGAEPGTTLIFEQDADDVSNGCIQIEVKGAKQVIISVEDLERVLEFYS